MIVVVVDAIVADDDGGDGHVINGSPFGRL